jgi:hypothetical protein
LRGHRKQRRRVVHEAAVEFVVRLLEVPRRDLLALANGQASEANAQFAVKPFRVQPPFDPVRRKVRFVVRLIAALALYREERAAANVRKSVDVPCLVNEDRDPVGDALPFAGGLSVPLVLELMTAYHSPLNDSQQLDPLTLMSTPPIFDFISRTCCRSSTGKQRCGRLPCSRSRKDCTRISSSLYCETGIAETGSVQGMTPTGTPSLRISKSARIWA